MEDHGSESKLPGRVSYVRAFSVSDRAAFIRDMPDWITRLRMRNPLLSWSLDLSVASLKVLDEYVGTIIDKILERGQRVDEAIDRDLVEDIVAYVGEVIVRSTNGRWEAGDAASSRGPLVIHKDNLGSDIVYRGLDVYQHVLRQLVEAARLARGISRKSQGLHSVRPTRSKGSLSPAVSSSRCGQRNG